MILSGKNVKSFKIGGTHSGDILLLKSMSEMFNRFPHPYNSEISCTWS